MSDAGAIEGIVPTQDERTMGTLAHVLQLVGGWIAPLIIFLVKRNSRFVSFHALQVLLLQALYFAVVMIGMGGFFIVMAVSAFHPQATQHSSAPPVFFLTVRSGVDGNDGLVGVHTGGGHCVRNQGREGRMG